MNPRLIRAAQCFLILGGHDAGGRLHGDGVLGMLTKIAVRSYQEAHELGATGVIDEALVNHMYDNMADCPSEPTVIQMQAFLILMDEGVSMDLIANGEPWPFEPAMKLAFSVFKAEEYIVYPDIEMLDEDD